MKTVETRICGNCRLFITAVDSRERSRSEAETEAVGRLVCEAFGPGATVGHYPSEAPYISGHESVPVSISHSRHTACLAVGQDRPVGVDVEEAREQLRRVTPRVLSENEMAVYGGSLRLLLRAWSMKEALYKAALASGIDFRTEIVLPADPEGTVASVRGQLFDILLVDETHGRTIVLTQHRGL